MKPLDPPGSFDPADVTLLLQDVTGRVAERPTDCREREIQAGRHYSAHRAGPKPGVYAGI